jgi:Sulfotransferase domain
MNLGRYYTLARASLDPTYWRKGEDSPPVYLYHVHKTGGTSLAYSFMGTGGEDPEAVYQRLAADRFRRTRSNGLVYVAYNQTLLERSSYHFGWSHLPAWSLSLPSETRTVTILRDPVGRLVSYYRFLADNESKLSGEGFDRMMSAIPREHLLRQLYMFSPRFDVSEAVDNLSSVDLVMRFESYASDLEVLSGKIDRSLVPYHRRVSSFAFELSPESEERARELLKPEYDFLQRSVGA